MTLPHAPTVNNDKRLRLPVALDELRSSLPAQSLSRREQINHSFAETKTTLKQLETDKGITSRKIGEAKKAGQAAASGNLAAAEEVYFTREMRNHHSSSVLVGDTLYGFSSSILTALQFDTGKPSLSNTAASNSPPPAPR